MLQCILINANWKCYSKIHQFQEWSFYKVHMSSCFETQFKRWIVPLTETNQTCSISITRELIRLNSGCFILILVWTRIENELKFANRMVRMGIHWFLLFGCILFGSTANVAERFENIIKQSSEVSVSQYFLCVKKEDFPFKYSCYFFVFAYYSHGKTRTPCDLSIRFYRWPNWYQ